jgi:hypothetical protein
LSALEVADAVEATYGITVKRTHVPRLMMMAGARVMSGMKPEVASLMGMALYSDTHPITWTDEPLTSRGIHPRKTTDYLTMLASRSLGAAQQTRT